MTASLHRTLSFFSKWLAEVVRQPWLMLSLVVGPFLILLAFGQGVRQGVPEPRTLLVMPPAPGADTAIQPVPADLRHHLDIVGQTSDMAAAREKLQDGDVDLVAVLPPAPLDRIRQGRHAPVRVFSNQIDPVLKSYARTYLNDQVGVLNRETVEKAIAGARQSLADLDAVLAQARSSLQALDAAQDDLTRARQAMDDLKVVIDKLPDDVAEAADAVYGAAFVIPGFGDAVDAARRLNRTAESFERAASGLDTRSASTAPTASSPSPADLAAVEASLDELQAAIAQARAIPPEVLAAPFELDLEDIAPFEASYIGFYGPAVLVLLLQHLGVTLAALSMARIRLLGVMELLQTAPVRPAEVVIGNYLSYGLLCAIAASVLLVLLTTFLGVPLFGSWLAVAGTLGLLLVTSLGIGFVISMLSSSEQQAAQLAMLVLIASVFFSGFIVSVGTIVWPVRALSYALPATYAIRTLQDVMLRGVLRRPEDLIILGAGGLALFFVTIRLFRREYRPA